MEQQNVPRWHADFAERNAKEHGELAKAIENSHGKLATEIAKAETRTTRWTVVIVAGATSAGVGVLSLIMYLING